MFFPFRSVTPGRSFGRWGLMCLTALLCFFQAGAQSVRIHSHNDYQKSIPFYRAYSQQVATMEADVYTDPASGDGLLVAHDLHELDSALTLDEMYLEPLVFLFSQNGGRAWRGSDRVLTLMVDLKTPLHPTIDRLIAKLKKHPEVFDPAVNPYAVRVAISGSRPDPADFGEFPDFISFDGFIDVEYTPQQLERVAFISEPFFSYSKWKGDEGGFSAEDRQVIAALVAKSHRMGKPIRFWGSPDTSVAWETFRELGVDIINTDRPEACTLYFQGNKCL